MLNLKALNPQQRLAVETIRGPVLVLAGAGTGKTRVITYRVAHLMEKDVPPAQILGVTFTNKAAREMQERVRQLWPRRAREATTDPPERPTICTFHSLCVRILRQHIERLGYKRNFVIFDESDQLAALKRILSRISTPGEKPDPPAILALLSRMRNGGSLPRLTRSRAAGLAEHVRRPYEAALHASNAVDFDDLILLTLRLFRQHPPVLEACRNQYRFVMVDEYQDTNAAQFELVHALAREHRNLCVVGDDDQSIYGWRGAEIANLLDLEKHFPEVRVIKLEQNYRSTEVILTAANALIQQNARRRGKQLWSRNGPGQKITLHVFDNDEAEAQAVVEGIEYARKIKRIPWSDQAILFRTNLQSRPLETALRQNRVRYQLIGGQSYFDRREVRDFLAYLRLFINPHDDVSLLRVANVPARGLSEATMERLLAASQERKASVFATMSNPVVQATFQARVRESLDAFLQLVRQTRAPLLSGQAGSLQDWADRFLKETGYLEELRSSEKDAEAAENRIRNVRELGVALDQHQPGTAAPLDRLQGFLEELTLDNEREEKEPDGEALTLITMHSCKGLEFPHVFIVGMEDGLLPHTRSKEEGTLEEERRLFYVAITRAMRTVSISHCRGRKKYGEVKPCHPSPFLAELPAHLIEHAEEKGKKPVPVAEGKKFFASLRETLGQSAPEVQSS